MFWRFHLMTSNIDTLLDKPDVTLTEIMDEDDVLQECKAQNRKLIDFLLQHMSQMVNMVTQEPSEECDEKNKYKYPNIACELLTSDVNDITEALAVEDGLLERVYAFLESEGPLNPLLASFFSKVMGLLIARKSDVMVQFLMGKDNFVSQLLHHLNTSAIMDLLLRLITCIDYPECRTTCINWLNEQQLVQKLVAQIDAAQHEEKHCNASQSLCDIVRLSREQMSQLQDKVESDPLLSAIESQETVSSLLDHMFVGEKNESVIVNGLAVIQALLEFRKIGPEGASEQLTDLDEERLAQGVSSTVLAITPRLSDFHQVLQDPPKQHYQTMRTTAGVLDPPLGNARLQTVRLIHSLLLTNSHCVNSQIASLGTVDVILDLYFKYCLNNFLHTQVEQCISVILSSCQMSEDDTKLENPLLSQLFTGCRLTERILEAWDENEQNQSKQVGHRKGYMGHLTRIANHILENCDKGNNMERIKEILQGLDESWREKWEKFSSGLLAEVNKKNTVELVPMIDTASEDDEEFPTIHLPESVTQKAFSDYQLQQMTSNFVDQFGFSEEDFAEQEERIDAPFTDKISSINFDMGSPEDNPAAASLFEQACNDRLHQFDSRADSDDDDLWEEKQFTISQSTASGIVRKPTIPGHARSPNADSDSDEGSEGSTDSEDDLNSPRVIRQAPETSTPTPPDSNSVKSKTEKMDVDSTETASEAWPQNIDDVRMDSNVVAMDAVSSPWESVRRDQSKSASGDDWAKFDNVSSSTSDSTPAGTGQQWADFTSFDGTAQLSSTAPDPQSSSHVAMDTATPADTSSDRTAKYLVASAPADLASQVSQSTDTEASQSHTPAPDSASAQNSGSNKMETERTEPSSSSEVSSEPQTTMVTNSESEKTISGEAVQPDSSTNPQTTDSAKTSSWHGNEICHDDDLEDDDGDDLGDNFNFLAASGLMKSDASHTDTPRPSSDSQSPNRTLENAKLEEARLQAKEALENFDLATGTPPAQNGPV